MEKKYIMTDEVKTLENGAILHRIQAIRDFGNVNEGDLGGWIEKEENLSHEGECWVFDNARVFGNAEICGNARIYDGARVFGTARIYDNAHVFGDVAICESVELSQNAYISNTWDYILIGPIGPRNDCITFYRNNDGGISVVCGCFNGTIEQFKERVKLRYIEDKYNVNPLCYRQYMDIIQYVINIMRYHWRINKYGKEIYNDR